MVVDRVDVRWRPPARVGGLDDGGETVNATRRGVGIHATLETLETARRDLGRMGLDGLDADRVAVVIAMMMASPLCTKEQAYEAAGRLFPLNAKACVDK